MPRGRPKTHIAPCSYCNRQFKRLEHLQRHERIHTQEKPFRCKCGLEFARKDLLARHTRLVHTSGNTPPNHETSVLPTGAEAPEPSPSSDNAAPAAEIFSILPDEVTMMDDLIDGQTDLNGMFPDIPLADGFDWLWQSDPGYGELSMAFPPFQPLMFDTAAFGLTNPFDSYEEDIEPSTAESFPSIPSFHPSEVATSFDNQASESDRLAGAYHALKDTPTATQTQTVPETSQNNAVWVIEGGLPAAPGDDHLRCPWRISARDYEAICRKMIPQKTTLRPSFILPSRHSLSRYLEGYIRGFHEHLPFLHLATFSPATVYEPLLLSLAAVGALYKYQMNEGYQLFDAAKALVMTALRTIHKDTAIVSESPQSLEAHPGRRHEDSATTGAGENSLPSRYTDTPLEAIQLIQALNVLVAMASWGKADLTPTAMELAGQLATLVKWFGVAHPDPISLHTGWAEWVRREQRRRTMTTAYALLNLQFVAFNTPTALTNQEFGLFLPHPLDMWRAPTELRWREISRKTPHRERGFRETVMELLSDHEVQRPAEISAFGNYVLMLALMQQILVDRQAAGLRGSLSGLQTPLVESLSRSIQGWARCWGSNNESTVDPQSVNGPLAFNATALLRIAYIRIVVDLGPHRSVLTRNPLCLARSVSAVPLPALKRSCYADFAVGQCVGALGILVRSGIDYVARTYSHTWSIIHSLSHVECACFLSLWLRNLEQVVRDEGFEALRPNERKLLGMITSMVREAGMLQPPPVGQAQDGVDTVHRLAAACVKTWAKVLQGEHVFEMVGSIAKGLSMAADILGSQLEDTSSSP